MQNVSIQKAGTLSAEVKVALESLLGRPLQGDEEVSVMAFRPHQAPPVELRQQLAARLNELMDGMAERSSEVPDEELDNILDEGMRAARPDYRPKK